MIVELTDKVSAPKKTNRVATPTKEHFFRIQLTIEEGLSKWERRKGDRRTQAMDPHERTSRFPFLEIVTLRKPCGRATVMRFPGNILIHPWIWSRQPPAKVLLQLIPYKVYSACTKNDSIGFVRTFDFVYFDRQFLDGD